MPTTRLHLVSADEDHRVSTIELFFDLVFVYAITQTTQLMADHLSPTGVGQYRQIFRGPTLTLDELELHATTLNPGQSSHPPHKHPNEELVILASGTLEATSNGKVQRLGPGSVIFNASNELHSVRNVGDVPATYTVVNWTSPLTPREAASPKAPAVPSAPAAPAKP